MTVSALQLGFIGLGIMGTPMAKAGADPAKVRQALMGGFAASRILARGIE